MGLLDFAQAASNTAADTVAAPVDAIAWILRKAGIPVNAPVGGSEWMTSKGLRRDVPQSAASLAGETAGLLSPVVAAAKAPQIARGLLQAGDNLAAPRTLNPQTGAIVWHGSPHKFDRFDSSKIGTGEGAQAYGHGLYLAEAPEVSQTYMRTQINNAPELERMALRAGASPEAANTIAQWYHSTKGRGGIDAALDILREPHPAPYMQKYRDKLLAEEPAMRKAWEQFSDKGHLYKVDLPDTAIARMLDWDKPLSQQAPEVQQALRLAGVSVPDAAAVEATKRASDTAFDAWQEARRAGRPALEVNALKKQFQQAQTAHDGANAAMKKSGADAYRDLQHEARDYAISAGRHPLTTMLATQSKASDDLRAFGIPGIRYLDGGSRGAGSGTSNFVVFPGEENLLRILERNGQPLGLLGP